MNLWAVTMVRDELDVLPYTLAHLAHEGVDGIIVADNLSVDGTWEWLQDVDLGCELHVRRDEEVGYYQSRKMTALVKEAFSRGADWVIPFDADELWHNADAVQTLHDTLAKTEPGGYLRAELHNYFPTSDDGGDPNPFVRITHRDASPSSLTKVIVSDNPQLVISQGNHDAVGEPPWASRGTTIEVAHFPWRSARQFIRKAGNGARAYAATDLPWQMGEHWRSYGALLERDGVAGLEQIYHTWFCDPPGPVEHQPAPWRRYYLGQTR